MIMSNQAHLQVIPMDMSQRTLQLYVVKLPYLPYNAYLVKDPCRKFTSIGAIYVLKLTIQIIATSN